MSNVEVWSWPKANSKNYHGYVFVSFCLLRLLKKKKKILPANWFFFFRPEVNRCFSFNDQIFLMINDDDLLECCVDLRSDFEHERKSIRPCKCKKKKNELFLSLSLSLSITHLTWSTISSFKRHTLKFVSSSISFSCVSVFTWINHTFTPVCVIRIRRNAGGGGVKKTGSGRRRQVLQRERTLE